MEVGVISVRYARALLKCSTDAKVEDKVYHEMKNLAESFIAVPALRSTLDNPMLSCNIKKELLCVAMGKDLTELTKKFIDLILNEGRGKFVQFIANSYITLYRKQKNIIRGKLITAIDASPEISEKMQKLVQNKTNGTVEFDTEVNPDIIGGFIFEYDTYRIDASIKTMLNSVLKQLNK